MGAPFLTSLRIMPEAKNIWLYFSTLFFYLNPSLTHKYKNNLLCNVWCLASGILNTLLFIHIKNDKGLEVSGHVDLNQRFADDPNFQKYMKGTLPIIPQLGDLTFHQWKKGKTNLGSSDNWEIIADFGETGEFRNKNSGFRLKMDILQGKVSQGELRPTNKRKGRKEKKERCSSSCWTEIEFNKQTGTRILFWDLYWTK